MWYSMLAGLLRDAAEELRDLEDPLAQVQRIQQLFGAEGADARSAVVCRSLHFDGDRSASPAGRTADGDPLFVNVTSTSREVHSRRPIEETLRTIEYAKAGLTAPGELRFRGDDQDGQLRERCLRRLVALGGGRTRGAGRIRLSPPCVEPLPEPDGDRSPFPAPPAVSRFHPPGR